MLAQNITARRATQCHGCGFRPDRYLRPWWTLERSPLGLICVNASDLDDGSDSKDEDDSSSMGASTRALLDEDDDSSVGTSSTDFLDEDDGSSVGASTGDFLDDEDLAEMVEAYNEWLGNEEEELWHPEDAMSP
ncbi:MAG: hypothetical protein Q9165_002423 [Trypethelium subeluteriae]